MGAKGRQNHTPKQRAEAALGVIRHDEWHNRYGSTVDRGCRVAAMLVDSIRES